MVYLSWKLKYYVNNLKFLLDQVQLQVPIPLSQPRPITVFICCKFKQTVSQWRLGVWSYLTLLEMVFHQGNNTRSWARALWYVFYWKLTSFLLFIILNVSCRSESSFICLVVYHKVLSSEKSITITWGHEGHVDPGHVGSFHGGDELVDGRHLVIPEIPQQGGLE